MAASNAYDRTLPAGLLDGSTNPDLLTEVMFGSHLQLTDGSVPMIAKVGSGRMSPVRARTMKEYDEQIAVLKKENFSLKLRIYFLEERMQQKFGDGEDVFKTNIQLKVECESAKKELEDKQELLKKASHAIEHLSSNHQQEMAQVRGQVESEMEKAQHNLMEELEEAHSRMGESEQLLREKDEDILELQEKLDEISTQMKFLEQKGDNSIKELMAELKEKSGEVQSLMDRNQALMEDHTRLRSEKDEVVQQLEQLSKELNRRDRDLEDVVDDQIEKIDQLQKELSDQHLKIQNQEETIGKLEDFLKVKEQEKKGAEKNLKEAEENLVKEKKMAEIRDSTILGMRKAISEKTKEMKFLAENLKKQEEESKRLQEEFNEMALQRQTSAEQYHEEVGLLERQLAGVKSDLRLREAELENLMRTLGKKEGELEGFKELLSKAQNALQQSEDAVEVLQDQLKKEQSNSLHPVESNRSAQHYKDLYEDSKKRLAEKEDIISQLKEAFKDKERQLRKSIEIFSDPDQRALEEKDRQLAKRDDENNKLRQSLTERGQDLERANKMLQTAEDTIKMFEKTLKDKEHNTEQIRDCLKEAEDELESTKSQHLQAVREKEAIIKKLQAAIAEKDAFLEDTLKRAPVSTEEFLALQRQLQNKDRELHEAIEERDKTSVTNAESMNSLLKKLQGKEVELKQVTDKCQKDLANKELEMVSLRGEINRLGSEVRRKEAELQNIGGQAEWSSQQHQGMLDKLRAVIADKDKTIQTLIDSVQEKDRTSQKMQNRTSSEFGQAQRKELEHLRSQVTQLRDHLKNKDELISKQQSLLQQNGDSDQNSRLQELLIELATKTEALKAARTMEQDLRQQLQELKEQLKSHPHGDKEFHRLEREVIYLKDQVHDHGGWSQSSPADGSTGMDEHLLQETLKVQLEEVKKLCSCVQAEREYMKDFMKNHSSEPLRVLEEELTAIQALKHELEEGVERNSQMRAAFERQMKDVNFSEPTGTDDLKKCLSYFKLELEASKISNALLQSKINDLQYKRRVEGVGKAQSSHQGTSTSPGKCSSGNRSPGSQSPGNRSPSPFDCSIPLNRQNLSDMSAPMLRKLIRQLQHQLSQLEKDNAELRQKLCAMVDRIRDVPGKNDDDVNCIPFLKAELDSLKRELELKEEEIIDIQSRQVPGSEKRILTKDTAVQTITWSSTDATPSSRDCMLKGGQGTKKLSQIPRPKKTQPITTDLSTITQPEMLKTLLLESKRRITELEDKLKATEGTVRFQTQKMKHYKGILQEHGLSSPSPTCSRSSSESNLLRLFSNGKSTPEPHATSHDHLPEVGALGNIEYTLEQGAQTRRGMDDPIIPTNTLHDLRQEVDTLQRHLQETKDTNAELQQKLLQQQHTLSEISDLRQQLGDSQTTVSVLENRLTSLQGSSVQQVLTSQKEEIVFLRKRMIDTRNSCLQLNTWLEEVSQFLTTLMYKDQDTEPASGQVRGIRSRIDQSMNILRSFSSSLLLDEETEISPETMTDEYKTSVAEKDAILHSQSRLMEELNLKNQEVERLTFELRNKNTQVERLTQELLIFHSRFTKTESPKSSTSSSAPDGNVEPKRLSKSPTHKGKNTSSDAVNVSGQDVNRDLSMFSNVTLRSHNLSLERMRHMTGSSSTDGIGSMLQQPVDIEMQDAAADSSQASTGYHSSRLSAHDISNPTLGFEEDSFAGPKDMCHYTNLLDTDDHFLYNRRLTDDHLFDSSPSQLGFTSDNIASKTLSSSRPRSSGHHVNFSLLDKSSRNGQLDITLTEEVDLLTSRLHTMEDLNKTLKEEISVYENLCKTVGIQCSPTKYSPSKSSGEIDKDLVREHLAELRALRMKLEPSLKDSDRLRQQLEQNMANSPTDTTTTNVYMYSKQQTTITELQQTVQRLQQIIKQLQQQLQDKGNELQEVRRQCQEKDQSVREWPEKTSTEERTLVLQQKRIEQQDSNLAQLRHQIQSQESCLQQQKVKITKLEQSIVEKEDIVIQSEAAAHKQTEHMKLLVSTIKKQGEHIKELENTITEHETKVEDMEQTIKTQGEKIKSKEMTVEKQEKQINSLNEKVEHEEMMKREKNEANKRYMEQNKRLGEDNRKLETLKQRLSQDNEKLQQRNARLNQELKHADMEMRKLQHDMESVKEKAQENKDLNNTLRLELSVYEKLEAGKENVNPNSSATGSKEFDVRELLTEISKLRIVLERCIDANNALRQKLEEHLAHQQKPHYIKTTNVYQVKDVSPARSQGTDVPDGQPSPERPFSQTPGMMTPEKGQGQAKCDDVGQGGVRSATISSRDSVSDNLSVSTPSDVPSSASFGMATWPGLSAPETMQDYQHGLHASRSAPGGTVHHSLTDLYHHRLKVHQSEGNIVYHVDDPPSLLADYTSQKVDSDMRNLFAIGKLDDYEKLKTENRESLVALKGIEARIQSRLKTFQNVSTLESVEYSTLRELSLSTEHLRICLDEGKSLIECFWTAQLPKDDPNSKILVENQELRSEVIAAKSKCDYMLKEMNDAERRLHASNEQREKVETRIYKQLKKTSKVMSQARSNFERNIQRAGLPYSQVSQDQLGNPLDADNETSHS